ncbi:hypothetical protein CASFOL_011728 [Castilleja foliolosa]|uniref:S-protein homolog n=1 Tax=Castilleja foliolosa TaxID=1961234 RepID=A0ABD3DU83_9LAMI
MNYTTMSMNLCRLLVISVVLFQSFTPSTARYIMEKPVFVYVKDALPQGSTTLFMHCTSGDDDLGNHTLTTGQDFHFSFCIAEHTLFFCHLWWNGKNAAFEVFNNHKWTPKMCPNKTCNWEARGDDIYFKNNKKYDWNNTRS